MVPPVINKFYALDIAPGRSMVEYFLQQGLQVLRSRGVTQSRDIGIGDSTPMAGRSSRRLMRCRDRRHQSAHLQARVRAASWRP